MTVPVRYTAPKPVFTAPVEPTPAPGKALAVQVAPKPPSLVLDQETPVAAILRASRMPIGVQAEGKVRGRPSGVATIILGPLGVTTLQEEGNGFVVLVANLPVQIQPQPAGRMETYYAGMSANFCETFNFVSLKNPSKTATLTLKLWCGFEDLENYQAPAIPVLANEGLTVIASTGVIQALSTVDNYFRTMWFYGFGAMTNGVGVVNAGNVNIGRSLTYQPDILAPGQWFPYSLPDRQLFNLANIGLQGTALDGVFWTGT